MGGLGRWMDWVGGFWGVGMRRWLLGVGGLGRWVVVVGVLGRWVGSWTG